MGRGGGEWTKAASRVHAMKRSEEARRGAGVVVVDRLDGDVATLVYREKTFTLPRSLVPREVREGDSLRVSFVKDDEATKKMKRDVGARLERLRDGDGGGNESL